MSAKGLTEAQALRIGLAARALPETEPHQLMETLVEVLGLPLTEKRLESVTEQQLREAGNGAFAETSLPAIKQAMDCLRGKGEVDSDAPPEPEGSPDDVMLDSIRVAVSSNTGEEVDGHFGTCSRYLIYQVSPEEVRLVDVRRPGKGVSGVDKNVPRARLLGDCLLLYTMSIGGPAAAQVVKRDVHPVKIPEGGPAREVLARTQATLADHPPPWLAKAMAQPQTATR